MRYTKAEIEAVRYGKYTKCKLDKEFDEFMRLETKVVLCHFEEGRYATPEIAAATLGKGVKHWGYPIKVCRRKDKVYLVRTDM